MPTQMAVERAVAWIGGQPRRQEGAGRVWVALLIGEMRAGVRCPRIDRVLRKGFFVLRAGVVVLPVLREGHAVVGRDPPVVPVVRGKPVQQGEQRALLPGAAGTGDQA